MLYAVVSVQCRGSKNKWASGLLGGLVKNRMAGLGPQNFWLSRSGVWLKNLYFKQVPRKVQCWCCRLRNHTLTLRTSKGEECELDLEAADLNINLRSTSYQAYKLIAFHCSDSKDSVILKITMNWKSKSLLIWIILWQLANISLSGP